MKTKLITTEDYLLLIDEEAEIKEGDCYFSKNNNIVTTCDSKEEVKECAVLRHNDFKIIAYYPLTDEAKELDLPWLPNPFEDNFDLKQEIIKWYHSKSGTTLINVPSLNTLVDKAQSKQFSLEDMKEAFNAGGKHIYECEANGKDKKCYCRNDNDCNQRNYLTAEEYVQSLSTQQLPKEFIPEELDGDDAIVSLALHGHYLKTITNSEGKEELVGTYKY